MPVDEKASFLSRLLGGNAQEPAQPDYLRTLFAKIDSIESVVGSGDPSTGSVVIAVDPSISDAEFGTLSRALTQFGAVALNDAKRETLLTATLEEETAKPQASMGHVLTEEGKQIHIMGVEQAFLEPTVEGLKEMCDRIEKGDNLSAGYIGTEGMEPSGPHRH